MKIVVKHDVADTTIQVIDPSQEEGEQVCSETCVPSGSEVELVLPNVHSAEGVQVGEVCESGAEPQSDPAGSGESAEGETGESEGGSEPPAEPDPA